MLSCCCNSVVVVVLVLLAFLGNKLINGYSLDNDMFLIFIYIQSP